MTNNKQTIMTYGPWILSVALFLLLGYVMWSSSRNASRDAQHAESLETALAVTAEQRDSVRADRDSLSLVVDSIAVQYSADSLGWAEERARLRGVTDRAERQRSQLAVSLAEHLSGDTVAVAMLDSLNTQHRIVVTSLTSEILTLQEERAALWDQRETMAELYEAALAENALNLELATGYEEAATSWQSAYRNERRAKRLVIGGVGGAAALVALLLLR